MAGKNKNAFLENVEIKFKNFSGAEGQYNREGDRNFAVMLDPDTAKQMAQDEWPIKYLKPRVDEEGKPMDDGEPQAFMKVKVSFKLKAPKLVMITSRGRTTLPEDMAMLLDWAEISHVDMKLNQSYWDFNGRTGYTAYLESIYVTIVEDQLELKYADIPEMDSAQKSLTAPPEHDGEVISGEWSDDLSLEGGRF